MVLAYAICKVPIAPMRASASHKAEMVSQLLFGEKCIIADLNDKTGWMKVINEWDDYVGWLKITQCQIIDKKQYFSRLIYYNTSLTDKIQNPQGHFLIPFCSHLTLLREKHFKWLPHHQYIGKKIKVSAIQCNKATFIKTAHIFIGTAYLWGGRSQMGIDCSGFTQMVYKYFNIRLPRDAGMQVHIGRNVDFLSAAQLGDLAFFDNENGDITHVGILLSPQEIIHATESSGCVVVDTIDNGGIISKLQKKRTHHLRIIKRITDIQ